MVLAVLGGMLLLRRKGEPLPKKLLREYYLILILGIIVSLLLYIAYALKGQSQGGWVVALSSFFGVLGTCMTGRLLFARSQHDRKSVKGKTLLAGGLTVLWLVLVYGFFSIWNIAALIPGLMFGYAFGVALVALLIRARLGVAEKDKMVNHHVQLIEYASVLTTVLVAALALNPSSFFSLRAAGLLLFASLITVALSHEHFSLRGAFIVSVLGFIGVVAFRQIGSWPVLVGIATFFVLVLLGIYYSSSKYRVVRTVVRLAKEIPYATLWTLEGVFACTLLFIIAVFLSNSLAIKSALSGWFGISLALTGMVGLGSYILSRIDQAGDKLKSIFLAFAGAGASLLVFAVIRGKAAVNLAKVEVVLAVLLGFALVLFWAWLSSQLAVRTHKLESTESCLRMVGKRAIASVALTFIGVAIVAAVTRAESLAGFVAGLFAGGFVFGLWGVFTGTAIGDAWRERSGIPVLVLAAALLALILVPLVV